MAATTVGAVKSLIAGMLGLSNPTTGRSDPTKLEAFWTDIIEESVDDAEAWLRDTLLGMGFPADEIAVWPMFNHYHKRLSVWMAGAYRAGELSDVQKSALDRFDCRAEVMAVETLGKPAGDRLVAVADLERDDDPFRRPSVCATGSIPGDVFDYRSRLPPDHWR